MLCLLALSGLASVGCRREPAHLPEPVVARSCNPSALGLRTRSGLKLLQPAVDGASEWHALAGQV